MPKSISVLVPAHNEERYITGTLRSLLHQTVPLSLYEIVVVDDGSTDGTSAKVKAAARKNRKAQIKLVRKKVAGGKSSALNRGIREAEGRFILITDADIVVSRDWIEKMSDGLKEFDMVQGAWVGYRPETFSQKLEHAQLLAQYRYGGLYVKMTRNGANNGFRREVYDRAGPFDEKSVVVTQGFYQRGLDAGFSLTYLRDSVVYTHSNARFSEFVKQRLRWREYDGISSLLRTGVKGLLFTLDLSCLTFFSIFLLPFLFPYLPLYPKAILPWWSGMHLMLALVLLVLAVEYSRYVGPVAMMNGKGGKKEDARYTRFVIILPLVLLILRILTIPYYIYRCARPRRSGHFQAVRE